MHIHWINIQQQKIIGGVCRVPNTNIKTFCQTINKLIEPHRSYEIVLLGDYNTCLLQDIMHKQELQNPMQSNGLFPAIFSPTRVATILRNGQPMASKTLIDNIYLNTQNLVQSGTLKISRTEHYAVFAALPEHNIYTIADEIYIQ